MNEHILVETLPNRTLNGSVQNYASLSTRLRNHEDPCSFKALYYLSFLTRKLFKKELLILLFLWDLSPGLDGFFCSFIGHSTSSIIYTLLDPQYHL